MIISAPILERPHIVFSGQVLWAIAVTGLLGTALGFGAQGWAQQFTPPTHTALIFSLEPVFALGTSYVVLGERLGFRAGAGAAMILGGVLLGLVESFASGLIYGYVKGWDWYRAARMGNACGAIVVTRPACSNSCSVSYNCRALFPTSSSSLYPVSSHSD